MVQVQKALNLARFFRYVLYRISLGMCFYTLLGALLALSAAAFLRYVALWSILPIVVIQVVLLLTFTLGFVAGNSPVSRVARLQLLRRPVSGTVRHGSI